jgi:hypothetical protein
MENFKGWQKAVSDRTNVTLLLIYTCILSVPAKST